MQTSTESILEKINLANLSLLSTSTLEETYTIIIREALKLVDAPYGSLVLEKEGELKRVYSNLPIAQKVKIRKQGLTYKSFMEKKAFVVHNEELRKNHPEFLEIGVSSNIFIPISYKGKSIGVLIINSNRDESLTTHQLHILKLFGSLASLRIKEIEAHSEVLKALEVRDLFISMAAHELRTPLTTISGYIQLLHNRMSKNESQESSWINSLSYEARRLTRLVSELLTVNRIRSGQLDFIWKECHLNEVISLALKDLKLSHPKRHVNYHNETNYTNDVVIGDYDKLLQVVLNVVDNAFKFSPVDSDITITLTPKSNFLLLKVKDFGRGIRRKDLPKVFDSFYKGTDHTKEGMGLGLFLAKHIIISHRGEINIHSKVNQGSIVEIKLPRIK